MVEKPTRIHTVSRGMTRWWLEVELAGKRWVFGPYKSPGFTKRVEDHLGRVAEHHGWAAALAAEKRGDDLLEPPAAAPAPPEPAQVELLVDPPPTPEVP